MAGANGAVIDLDYRSDLRACAAENDLVGSIQFGAVNLAFAGNQAQFTPGQLDDCGAGNAQENIFGGRRGNQFAIDDQEDVLSAALGDMSLVCEHNRFIIAIL